MPERELIVSPTVETIDNLVSEQSKNARWAMTMSAGVGSDVGRLLEAKPHAEHLREYKAVALRLDRAASELQAGETLGALAAEGQIDRRSYLLGAASVLSATISAFEMAEYVRLIRKADEEDSQHWS